MINTIEIRAPRDWRAVVDQMGRVEKLVHLAHRRDTGYIEEMRAVLVKQIKYVYETTIRMEVMDLGCPDPGRIVIGGGPALQAINERAKESSKGIANTYNYDLAMAIRAIRQDTPTANRNTYVARLRGWESARAVHKNRQIGLAENGWAIDYAKTEFYRMNDIPHQAEVYPHPSVCPICAALIAQNPWPSIEEAHRASDYPVHVGCPHHLRILPDARPTPAQCADLWKGDI